MFVSCFYFFYSYFVYLHFFSIFMYLCIYLFCFYFLFQKDYSFFNMFYNENNFLKKLYFCLIKCRSPSFPQGFFLIEMAPRAAPCSSYLGRPALPPPRQLLWAASRSSGRVSALACPVCHHRQTDRQTPLLLLYTNGCPWPSDIVKSPGSPIHVLKIMCQKNSRSWIMWSPLCEIQVPKLRSHILKITS